MSELVGIIGESGTGKSTAILRNESLNILGLDPKETFIISVAGKGLPTKGWKGVYKPKDNWYVSDKANNIKATLLHISSKMEHIKNIIIDDAHYSIAFGFMRKAMEKG